MVMFDTSSLIHAWNVYPQKQFPKFWEWLFHNIKNQDIIFSQIVKQELKTEELVEYIKEAKPKFITPNNEIIQTAKEIKKFLDLKDGEKGNGVGEEDIFIMATALVQKLNLVTNEAIQREKDARKRNYKIPRAFLEFQGSKKDKCSTYDLLTYIKKSEQIF